MFGFEWVTIVYVSGLLVKAAAIPSVPAIGLGLGVVLTVGAAAALAPVDVRTALPVVYLLCGYWLPGLLVRPGRSPRSERFEAWLVRTDAAIRPWLPGVPSWLAHVTDAAYLFCYPLVPVAFALAWARGSTAELDRLWVSMLGAGFLSYATLPWFFSRPPRVKVKAGPGAGGVKRLNSLILERLSHGWNTFPSGHAAVSWAAAISVWHIWPEAGAGLALVATAISVGAAAGGYHYVIDISAGGLTAVLVAAFIW